MRRLERCYEELAAMSATMENSQHQDKAETGRLNDPHIIVDRSIRYVHVKIVKVLQPTIN